MKKGVLLLLLLVTSVFAAENLYSNYTKEVIPRYTDFPLDNIHILRLQEAAVSLGGNVTELREQNKEWQELRSNEISQLQGQMDSFQRSMLANVAQIQSTVDAIANKVDASPQLEMPAEVKFPPYVIALLGANIFLLVVIVILIFWLREQYYVHRETHKEEHIHPAPVELINYVKHQLEHDKSLKDVRMQLAEKGWTPSIIEHAIHAAREK
jgi:hypothetical protein